MLGVFFPEAATWTARHSFAFARLTAGTATGRFYIVGGDDGQRQHDVWSSDDKGNTWQLMTFTHLREQRFNVFEERAPWNPTADVQAAISAEGTLTLPGGSRDDEVGFTNEVWELPAPFYEDITWYNRKQGDERVERDWKPLAWTKTETPQWVARKGHAVAMDGENTPYVLGGEDITPSKRALPLTLLRGGRQKRSLQPKPPHAQQSSLGGC